MIYAMGGTWLKSVGAIFYILLFFVTSATAQQSRCKMIYEGLADGVRDGANYWTRLVKPIKSPTLTYLGVAISIDVLRHSLKVVFAPHIAAWDAVAKVWPRSGQNDGTSKYHLIPQAASHWVVRNGGHLAAYYMLPGLGIYIPINVGEDREIDTETLSEEYRQWLAYNEGIIPRPDLYMDGKRLANCVAKSLWKTSNQSTRGARSQNFSMGSPLFTLKDYEELPITDPSLHKKLERWVFAQSDDSITPEMLYLKGFELTDGNIQEGLALVRNVLTREAVSVERRNFHLVPRKLVDITGERALRLKYKYPFGGSFDPEIQLAYNILTSSRLMKGGLETIRGDNISAWYHFAGTAVHAYANAHSRLFLKNHTIGQKWSEFAIHAEEDILFGTHRDFRKRKEIDFAGMKFGFELARLQKKYATADDLPEDIQNNCEYLYDNPEVYGPTWHLKPGQRPSDYVDVR